MSNKKFDLFKLHDSTLDFSNQSWICFYGPNFKKIIKNLSQTAIQKYNFNYKSELCKFIANKLNCRPYTIGQVLYGHKKWIPIIILNALLKMVEESEKYKQIILNGVTCLKCNSASSKIIKAVKNLDITLCKIAGAHAADGCLHHTIGIEIKNKNYNKDILKIIKKYNNNAKIFITSRRTRIKIKNIDPQNLINNLKPFISRKDITIWFGHGINLAEGHEVPVSSYKNWIEKTFGLNAKISKYKTKNAWRVDFDNKIIARYFNLFLGFPIGHKTYTVSEPQIIKKSSLEYRNAFLLGVLTFDGYVAFHRKFIGSLLRSKNLTNSIKEILTQNNIPVRPIKKDKKQRWACNSYVLNKKELKIALNFFEKNTPKWQKLEEYIRNS